MDEQHLIAVMSNNLDVIYVECTCGWTMHRPGEGSDAYEPWPVKEIVDVCNQHLSVMIAKQR